MTYIYTIYYDYNDNDDSALLPYSALPALPLLAGSFLCLACILAHSSAPHRIIVRLLVFFYLAALLASFLAGCLPWCLLPSLSLISHLLARSLNAGNVGPAVHPPVQPSVTPPSLRHSAQQATYVGLRMR